MKFKKAVSILLCVSVIFCCLAPFAAASDNECDCGELPLVYVGPLGNTTIYQDADTENERQLFRLTTETTVKLVFKLIPTLILLKITGNYEAFGNTVVSEVNGAMGMLALDGNGNSYENVTVKTELPTDAAHGKGRSYYFHYDWRLDPLEVAAQLKEFVEHIKALTGHSKVDFKASSMGGVVTMAYFSKYGYSDVQSCILQCCPLLGTNVAGELLCRQLALDGRALLEYGSQAYPPADAEGVLLHSLFNFLYYSGLVDAVMKLGGDILDKLTDKIFDELMTPVFGTLLGLWSFVPDEYYEQAKAINLNRETQAGLIAKADAYHYGVQGRAEELLEGAVNSGVRVMIVAGYNMRRTPLVRETIDWNSDGTVDTCYASAGATVAPFGKTLPEGYAQKVNDGHNHLSPDGVIDASTCILPENTWFIKDMLHSNGHDGISAMYDWFLYSDGNPNVWSDARYPQFIQNDKPNLRLLPMGNFADGSKAPQPEKGSSFYDSYQTYIAPVESFFLGIFDFIRGE